jgi:hypothetical protein
LWTALPVVDGRQRLPPGAGQGQSAAAFEPDDEEELDDEELDEELDDELDDDEDSEEEDELDDDEVVLFPLPDDARLSVR